MLSKNYILPSEKLYPAFCQRTFNLGILWQHMQHRKCCAFGVDRTTIIYQKQSNSNPRMHCTDTIIGKNHLSFTFHRVVHWYRGMYDPLPKTCFSMWTFRSSFFNTFSIFFSLLVWVIFWVSNFSSSPSELFHKQKQEEYKRKLSSSARLNLVLIQLASIHTFLSA